MKQLPKSLDQKQERTLLVAVLLSLGAPITTGIAVLVSESATQVADFIRRSVELLALVTSWYTFRFLRRNPQLKNEQRKAMEIRSSLFVATAMILSGLVMMAITVKRADNLHPGGNLYPGILVSVGGAITNSWFWIRYTRFLRLEHNPIIYAQRSLYRAKTVVDLCILTILSFILFLPGKDWVKRLDVFGSILVGAYLLWSGVKTAQYIKTGPADAVA
jgi:divalent metal cation (Fe/Co/Zn/Cd) transporter